MNTQLVRDYLLGLQQRIVTTLERLDGQEFLVDAWQREPGGRLEGDGLVRLIENGAVFERGGVNFSHVRGRVLPPSATAHRPELAGAPFEAMGVSLVLHPHNPFVPTVHMNVRMFAALPADREPVVVVRRRHGPHAVLRLRARRAALPPDLPRRAGAAWRRALPALQAVVRRVFLQLKHRNEPRGIGGIFFDDLNAEGGFDQAFGMLQSVGDAFLPAYEPIVERRHGLAYGERERDFQAYRRGRYVEFNLVFDRGTLFGLQSGGRTESILMSMPPVARWRYDWQPEDGSPEARLYSDFLRPRDWADEVPTHLWF